MSTITGMTGAQTFNQNSTMAQGNQIEVRLPLNQSFSNNTQTQTQNSHNHPATLLSFLNSDQKPKSLTKQKITNLHKILGKKANITFGEIDTADSDFEPITKSNLRERIT